MPSYFLTCEACGEAKTRRFQVPQKFPVDTCKCGGTMKRRPRPPSTQVKEALDNGAMTHRLERYANAEELYKDRARKDPQKQ